MTPKIICALLFSLSFGLLPTGAVDVSAAPVTPGASPEARALLQVLYELSGKHLLTGQHNYPNIKDRNTQFAASYLGKTPAVFSTDFGHAKAGDSDSYLARADIVQECIRQHRRGALVTICWHAVPPTADEPVTFRPLPGSDPAALRSVQGRLLDHQFRDLLTPGTPVYEHWCAQVDAIAVFLKQLEAAHVPVLWRPYHEMNGDWFWWGGRGADTAALYRQIYDRLVEHHQLKNLIWVWSMDRVSRPGMEHAKYFPGIQYVDVLGLDVYGNDFAQSYYESLEKLSQGKPLALAEVGNPPSLEILSKQPKWTYFVTWAGMVRNTPKKTYDLLLHDPRVLSLEDPAYANVMALYRQVAGLPPIHFASTLVNFSGTWIINEEKSAFGRMGAASAPARLEVNHHGNSFTVRTTRILEYADDQVSGENLTLDGAEVHSEFMNSPRTTTARLSADGTQVATDSTIQFAWSPPGTKSHVRDTWQLVDGGRRLSIQRVASTPAGPQTTTLVFDRR